MRGDRPLVAGRPQPQVELVEHAFGGRRRDGGDQPLGQAGEVVRRRERLWPVGFLGLGVVIVEQDQVDVGAGGQLAAAELAHAEDRHLVPPATRPWRAANSASTASSAAPMVRSARSEKALPARAGVDRAGQQPDADQEFLLGSEDAQAVEHLLVDAAPSRKASSRADR